MKLNKDQYQEVLDRFLTEWPASRVSAMTLSEYTDVGNESTFCYQVEWGTEKLGSISGVSLVKFGIWKRKANKTYKRASILQDAIYSWLEKYGPDADAAFEKIRSLILEIVQLAQRGDFARIDAIDLHSMAKWKIAFLYSEYRILPLYSRGALVAISQGLGINVNSDTNTFAIHTRILERKDLNEGVVQFAFGLWHKFVEDAQSNSYYVVGSKYWSEEENRYVDMFPEMLKQRVIATGFLWDIDLNEYIGKPKSVIDKLIDSLRDQISEDITSVKTTISILTSLVPGDIIAIKSEGAYNNLTIIAYAQVVQREGKIYKSDPVLGQCIFVDYLEHDLNHKVGLNYPKTIHKVDPIKKPEDFLKIFGSYSLIRLPIYSEPISNSGDKHKNTESYLRKPIEGTTVNRIHNQIQNAFFDLLNSEYPNSVQMEYENRVDLLRENKDEIFFYEVKPYNSVQMCIREALGQLLQYHFLFTGKGKKVYLRVVGMANPTEGDDKFISYLKSSLTFDFDYEYFNPFE